MISTLPLVLVLAIAAAAAIPVAGRLFESPPMPQGEEAVFGPQVFQVLGSAQTYVEAFSGPTDVPGTRYRLEIINGAVDGSDRVSGAAVTLNGAEVVADSEVTTSVAEHSVEVELADSNVIEIEVSGADSSFIELAIWRELDPTFVIWGPESWVRGGPDVVDSSFVVPAGAAAPFYLHMVNGESDGTGRVTSGRITINGVDVIGPSDLSQKVGGLVVPLQLNTSGANTISAEGSGSPGSSFTFWIAASDSVAPVLSSIQPADSTITDLIEIALTGSVSDQTTTLVLVNGDTAQATGGGTGFTYSAQLTTEGSNSFAITAIDAAGNTTDSTRLIVRDTAAPVLSVTSPADPEVTNTSQLDIAGSTEDLTPVTALANGMPLTVSGPNGYTGSVELSTLSGTLTLGQEGSNYVTVAATDAAGNSASVVREVILDTNAPVISITSPADSAEVAADSVVVQGSVADLTAVSVTVDGAATPVAPDSSFSHAVTLVGGENLITVNATDAAGNSSMSVLTVIRTDPYADLPPDPATVAPAVDPSVATTLDAAAAFLYEGPDPIQKGVTPGTMISTRLGVIRGFVQTRDGEPLPGVTVSVKDHPEFGHTQTRLDGRYDLAVNAGGTLRLSFEIDGYLPAHRAVRTAWQDYAATEPVSLVALDTSVTSIVLDSASATQVARGSEVVEGGVGRRATLLFKPGTQADLVLPDGTTQPIDSLSVRATEYTVGANGPTSMPAELPPSVQYTYATEFSVDEAVAAGASEVRFSQPVATYVENFLGFPVGGAVPAGYYDREVGAWIPSQNGRIVEVVSTANGMADLDVDGSGVAADSATLAALGIDTAERQALATLYAVGTSLWRVPVEHFTPWDYNWPPLPPEGATKPSSEPGQDDEPPPEESTRCGSIIGCESQSLGEAIGVAGTPFSLHYTSYRTPGRMDRYQVEIPLTDSIVPDSLARIDVEVLIAGRGPYKTDCDASSPPNCSTVPDLRWSFAPAPDLTHTFTWDGKDAYGRDVRGGQLATVRIGFVYTGGYGTPPSGQQSFSSLSTGSALPWVSGSRESDLVATLWQEARVWVGPWDARAQGLGGWSLNVHHQYDPRTGMLYLGDGRQRGGSAMKPMIDAFAGTGVACSSIEDCGATGPALTSGLKSPLGLAAGPDGTLYFVDGQRVRKVDPDGIVSTVAGTGYQGSTGDGGPALDARLYNPQDVAIGPDGSLYVTEYNKVRSIAPDGIISTFAGTGVAGFSGDGGPAVQAELNFPAGIAAGPDRSVFIADRNNQRVRRVDPSGTITTFAGKGSGYSLVEGVQATETGIYTAWDVAVTPDGEVYIVSTSRILHVDAQGVLTRFAGAGSTWHTGDGGPARDAHIATPFGVAVDADGNVYFSDTKYARVRVVTADSIINTVVGGGGRACSPRLSYTPPACTWGPDGDGGAAAASHLHDPRGLAVGPDGGLYIAEAGFDRIRRVGRTLPDLDPSGVAIASEDGSSLYLFDGAGRHLETRNTLTGAVTYEFAYDSTGLVAITDADSLVTQIERNGAGTPTAIVAPFAQRTELAVDTTGFLRAIVDPAGDSIQLDHGSDGLLRSLIDPRGGAYAFSYDSVGRLIADTDPANESKTLGRVDLENGSDVTFTTPQGRTTTYRTEELSTGAVQRTVIGPDGLTSTMLNRPNDSTTTTLPDGTIITRVNGGDPRFGIQAPIVKRLSVSTPGGWTLTTTNRRATTLSDPADPLSLLTQLDSTTVNGRVYTSLYEQATRRFTSTTPTGRQSVTVVNEKGRVVKDSVSGLAATTYTYDLQGRVDSVTQAGRAWHYAYDAAGRLSSTTDPLGRTDSLFYDAPGRVTRQVLRDGGEINYGYDAEGNLTSLAPPGRPAHTFTYNAVGMDSIYDPPDVPGLAEDRTFYSYDGDRNLIRTLRPDSLAIDFAYDSAGRVDSIVSPGGVLDYSYSATTGQLTGITAPDGEALSLAYDGSLPTRETWGGTVVGEVAFDYDNDFRLSGLAVNGDTVAYAYDADGLLTSVGAMAVNRDAVNGLLGSTHLDGVTTRRGYNEYGDVVGDSAWANGALVFARTYQRDDLGRITSVEDFADSVTTTWGYGYDAAGRLETVTRDGSPYASYAFDVNGNRLSRTSSAGVETGTYDAQDRLLSYDGASYTYTANGELATKVEGADTTYYDYDVFGNLKRVDLPDGTVVEYLIDGRNRRVAKKIGGLLVRGFLYGDQLNPVAELDSAGNVVSRFIYGSKDNVPDYILRAGETYRVVSDHNGSVRLVVNSSTGAVVQRISYDAAGKVLDDTNPGLQPFGWAGGLYDTETGLVRFGARDYSAAEGRWLTRDPVLFDGGFGLYQYAFGDPVNLIDPAGLSPCESWWDSFRDALRDYWNEQERINEGLRDLPPCGDGVHGPCLANGEVPAWLGGGKGGFLRNFKAGVLRSKGSFRIGTDPGAIRWGRGFIAGERRVWRIAAGGKNSFVHAHWVWGRWPSIQKLGSWTNYLPK